MKTTFTISHDILAIGVFPRKYQPEIRRIFEASDKKGGFITITIETVRKPRTTGEGSQSHKLNGNIQQICKKTYNDFGMVKSEIKYRAISRGYPILYDQNGKARKDIYGREMGISEADASVEECSMLIEESIALAAEENVKLIGD